jgi:hypothetical protein
VKFSTGIQIFEATVRQQVLSIGFFHKKKQQKKSIFSWCYGHLFRYHYRFIIFEIPENNITPVIFPNFIQIDDAGICDRYKKRADKTFSDLGFDNKEWAANSIVGSPSFFREKLHELHEKYGVTQFVFYDRTIEFKSRMKSLELLAREFN